MPEQENELIMARTPQPSVTGLPDEEPVEEVIVEETPAEESPTQEANGDDLSSLFETPSRDDPDMRIDDVVRVTPEDVFGEGGEDMSDLTEVTAEDVMGEDWGEPAPPPQPVPPRRVVIRKVQRTPKQYPPQPSIGGLRL